LTLDLLERYLFKKSRHQQPVTGVRKYLRVYPVAKSDSRGFGSGQTRYGAGDRNRTSDLRFTKFRESNLRQPKATRNNKPG
jgi:hypothetical protein